MNGLGDRDFAAMKIMLFLTGNAEGFGIAEKTIMDRCNISESSYKNARKKLVEKGWITHKPGEAIIVNYNTIFKGDTENTPNEKTMGITDNTSKGITDNTPLGDTDNTSKGYSKNTHNNIRNNINNNISNSECCQEQPSIESQKQEEKEEGSIENPIVASKEWLLERYNHLQTMANGLFYYNHKFYVMR